MVRSDMRDRGDGRERHERVGPDHQNEMASWDRVQRVNMIKKFRWPKMEQDETRPLRLPKEARDYFATPE